MNKRNREHSPPATPASGSDERPADSQDPPAADTIVASVEVGGRGGLDPTRYGDWEKNGRCIDF